MTLKKGNAAPEPETPFHCHLTAIVVASSAKDKHDNPWSISHFSPLKGYIADQSTLA
jgi:hypothetical protein